MTVHSAVLIVSLLAAASTSAQTPGQTPPAPPVVSTAPAPGSPPPPPGTPASRRESQPVNVKVELAITDQQGGAPPMKKTLSAVIGDGEGSFVRSTASRVPLGPGMGFDDVVLNMDASPMILGDGKIKLRFSLQYDLPAPPSQPASEIRQGPKTAVRETLALILESGKPVIAAQSADPLTDRQVTVEVKATILR